MPRVSAEAVVPFEVQAALIDASGKLFWYWDPYRHFLRKAGVHANTVARIAQPPNSKYQAMREILSALDGAGSRGLTVQRQLVQNMLALKPGPDVDTDEAKQALAALRDVAEQHDLLPETKDQRDRATERLAVQERRKRAATLEEQRRTRSASRAALFAEYCQLLQAPPEQRQGRGYRLEEMIGEVAALDGLPCSPPFRKGTAVQTDGMLTFEGFRYLIEARWRSDPADVGAVSQLVQKASRSLESTRALFLSVEGFRPEVVDEMERGPKNALLMSGAEFAGILEGRWTLDQALRLKVDEGSKKGHIFFDLTANA
jgi:hypothetical protein